MATPEAPAPADVRGPEVGAVDEGPSRFDVILRNRKRLLIVLLIVVLAAAVTVGSASVFTSSSANPNNTFTAGTLSQSNSKDNAAILTVSKMVPGESRNGSVTVKNTGDVSGKFSLSASDLTDTPGKNGGRLSNALQLEVVDTTRSSTVYTGPFSSMPKQDLGSWAANEEHSYRFTVTFPNSGKPAGPTTGDNAFVGSSTSITYTWDAVSE
jgi:spore coat-associated protein N